MKFEFFIARRYLVRGRKSSFISIISLVSIIGISIGVAALIIALSLINGFQGDIRNKILSSTAHIMVNNIVGDGLEGYEEVIKDITKRFKSIETAGPVVFGTILIKGSGKSASGAILRGVDLTLIRDEGWQEKLLTGRLPLLKNELLIGKELSRRMGLFRGDSCLIISPQPVLSPTGIIPRMKKFRVSGVFQSGLYEVDNSTIITNLNAAQRLFKLQNKISYIQIYLRDLFDAETIAEKLREILPMRLSVITWKDLNAALYSALEMEKTVLFFTLTLIIVVAALNIIAGLMLLVIQKIKDIGILLSYGATPKLIKRIFFIQGSIIGVLGTTVGVVIGVVFCYLANKFELIEVPAGMEEFYQLSYVPFSLSLIDILAVMAASLFISFIATLIPSKKAASINVVDAVKNE
ncbi:MAG: ABC transporter permease [Candidatus Aminicenantes bacterium]|nr:ABC transporter permease [Candidatus Aminicenantes bacterium]